MMREKIRNYYYSWKITWEYLSMEIIKHIPSQSLRKNLLSWKGASIASQVSIFSSVNIRCPKNLKIGKGCSIGPKVLLDARMGLEIKENVTIAYDAIIWTLQHEMNSSDFHGKGAPVVIEDYAWICSRAIVLPGIRIGKGSVVASGAVVTHDVEPFTVVGGIPARIIGHRSVSELDYVPYTRMHIV